MYKLRVLDFYLMIFESHLPYKRHVFQPCILFQEFNIKVYLIMNSNAPTHLYK